MKSNTIVWAKTLIFAYKYLEPMCNAIDKIIKNIAVNSFYSGGNWNDNYNCEKLSNKIINLTNKKIEYINLKILIEKALKKMNSTLAKILILRNIKELSVTTITSILNMSERTYFRRLTDAEEQFADRISKLGYSLYKLELEYSCDNLIKSIYNIVSCQNSRIDSLYAKGVDNALINNILKGFAYCC